jgi:zinc protease
LESNNGVAGVILNIERYQLGLDYVREYPSKINAIQPEDVLETARRYISPDKLIIVSAG